MKKTAARLADGREIIYFDRDDAPPRSLHDPRPLQPVRTSSELRRDPLLDEWVAIASHRQTRTHLPATRDCPLCPSRDGRQTEIPSGDYDVVVFENRFPALAGGTGRCEVMSFTSDHEASFATLPLERARLVIDAWADRTCELGGLPHIEQVYCFENRGQEIGVTLHHPHGQIYAYPFITPRTRQMLSVAGAHRERTGGTLFADVLAAERAGPRVVASSQHWTAFVPAAARWPVEVQLFPHRQVPDLPALDEAERDELAAVYRDVLRRMDRLYGTPLPYVAAWHQAPVRVDRELAWLHLQVFSVRRAPDKLKYLAGTEAGMGAFSNDVVPEQIAHLLRAAGAANRGAETGAPRRGGRGVWVAPGRVNLIGEHTDYNDGFVLPLALAQRVVCTAATRSDGRLVASSEQEPGSPLDVLDPSPGSVEGWGAYPAGVVWALRAAGHHVGGLELALNGDLPLGAGLSSSAAVCCAVALACNDLFELGLDRVALARAAQRAENDFVGAPVGIMDQIAVLHGLAGHAIFLDTRSLDLTPVPLRLREHGLALLVIDTHAPHRLVGGEYGARRRSCEQTAAALGVPALRDATPASAAGIGDAVLRRRARHVVTENARVLSVVQALRSGDDPRKIGPALTASHESLRDDFEVSCPELDAAVDAALRAGAYGARMTGGGFGGCAVALVDASSVQAVAEAVRTAFAARGFAPPATFVAVPSDGARRLS